MYIRKRLGSKSTPDEILSIETSMNLYNRGTRKIVLSGTKTKLFSRDETKEQRSHRQLQMINFHDEKSANLFDLCKIDDNQFVKRLKNLNV